jgi:hypothetical protein
MVGDDSFEANFDLFYQIFLNTYNSIKDHFLDINKKMEEIQRSLEERRTLSAKNMIKIGSRANLSSESIENVRGLLFSKPIIRVC